ncbi:MAG TPA: PHP domain-containing protein [Anaerolineales bacterium]|nr:PHP domain-containing protein [Anaerolineales bacterium]
MIRLEFHCHTVFSKDCLVPPERLVQCAMDKGIDRVVVTDHNTIAGAVIARQKYPRQVIVGEEIMTTEGELLAAFVSSEVPAGLAPEEAISRLKQQGAFISVSHPYDVHRKGAWREVDLLRILPLIDAIEIYNSRCTQPRHNAAARQFADRHDLAGTVGSDAHTCWELGRATQLLPPFETAADLRRAIRQAEYSTRWSPPWIHLTSRYAVLRKRLTRRLDTPPPP